MNRYAQNMFTIDHEFDASVVTLIDEGNPVLMDDVSISIFDNCVTIEQYNPRIDQVEKITFSLRQIKEIQAAMQLPEGSYRLVRRKD